MNVLKFLRQWQAVFYQGTLENPPFIPMTAQELDIIRLPTNPHEVGYYTGGVPVVFGTDVFETPFGSEMRDRQVKMPVERVCVADKSSVSLNLRLDQERDPFMDAIHRKFTAHICKDTTKLSATFEFDPWAKVKRALRITKWWPIRTKTIEIDGRILYPYLNITFPMNRHHVYFAITK